MSSKLAVTGDPLMDVKNVPNGAQGYIYFYFSDGSAQRGMYVTKDEFRDKKNKQTLGALGTASKMHRSTSVEGTFSVEGYDIANIWVDLEQRFRHEGVDEYFNILSIEYDPTTALGRKITVYYDCNVDEVLVSSHDVEDSVKTLSFAGTYDDYEVIQFYNVVDGLMMADAAASA